MLRRAIWMVLVAFIGITGFAGPAQAIEVTPQSSIAFFAPAGCKVEENLGATAADFIQRCRLGSILREFPSEYLDRTLAQIKVDRTTKGRKAWKLLTDSRFAKP